MTIPNMLRDEELLTLAEAASRLPRRNGKRVHTSSIWRWIRKGVRGVRLESRRLGGRMFTSLEALDRFAKQLAEVDNQATDSETVYSHDDRRCQIEEAERILDREGV